MAHRRSLRALVGSVLLCEAAGVVGNVFARNEVRGWYPTLHKPSFTPPGWVFGPVWTLLYAMMGVSLYLASRQREEDGTVGAASRVLFAVQLILNTLWTYIFFGRRAPGWALVEIVFLWVAVLFTTLSFSKVSTTAALLLVPYLLWTSFAAVLNYSIWRLNE